MGDTPTERTGPRLTRRQLLKAGAGIAAGAGMTYASYMELFARANAQVPMYGTLADIEHVIFVVQENRSYDHYFGTYKGTLGLNDPNALVRSTDNKSVYYQPDSTATAVSGYDNPGYRLPFRLDSTTLNGQACVSDPDHGWITNHRNLNLQPDGTARMDGFIQSQIDAGNDAAPTYKGTVAMGYYTKDDLPFYHALADSYTICDRYFASLIGQSDPNRIMSMAASIDPEGKTGGPVINTAGTNRASLFNRLSHRTMPEQLEAAGISWKVYQAADATPTTNLLTAFAQYHYNDPAHLADPLYQKAFIPSYPTNFVADVMANTLPAVSWILTSVADSEHPPAPPSFGEYDVSLVLNTVLGNPALYAKTAIFLTWDDPGGFFDHLVPPVPPAPIPLGEYITNDAQTRAFPAPSDLGPYYGPNVPIGLGFRVPMLVISPFTRGGRVCSDTFDHTSMLRFLETRFGTPVPNLTPWRRSITGDLTTAFNFGAAPNATNPGLSSPAPTALQIMQAAQCLTTGLGSVPITFPTMQMNAMQETGTRPRPSGPVIAEIASQSRTGSLPAGGDTISVSGRFFRAGATLIFGSTLASNTVVSADGRTITATIPAGTNNTVVDIVVTNPGGYPNSVRPNAFTYGPIAPMGAPRATGMPSTPPPNPPPVLPTRPAAPTPTTSAALPTATPNPAPPRR